MKVVREGKEYELQGGDSWNETYFQRLRGENPGQKVVAIETDGKREKYLIPIGELKPKPEPLNY